MTNTLIFKKYRAWYIADFKKYYNNIIIEIVI